MTERTQTFRANRLLLCMCALLLVCCAIQPAAAGADRSAALVIDANTGRVLHDKASNDQRYPASLTKMMTIYLAFEAIEAKRARFDDKVVVSARAAAAAPSKLGLKVGDEITLGNAIKALIVKSANDMAVAVAEHLAGSEAAFARTMTSRARQIGMNRTVFRNASGLPDPEQVTTARDMLTLAMRLQDDFPQHYHLFSLRSFNYLGKTYRSHNSLLATFPGVDGLKTGYTRASGFNLVSSFRAGNKSVVAIVMGGISAAARDAHMRMLLAQSLDKASTTRTRPKTPASSAPLLIAQARPAARPKVPAGEPAIAPPAPLPVVAKRPPADPTTATPASNTNVALALPPASAAGAPVEVARVRTVSVLPPAPSHVENASTSALPDAPPRSNFQELRDEIARRLELEADSQSLHVAAAPRDDELVSVNETAIAKPASTTSERVVERGRPPSTLQAQLAGLGLRPSFLGAQRPQFENSPSEVEGRLLPTAGTHHVQVGVYATQRDAERALDQIRAQAGDVLQNGAPITLPFVSGTRRLYRARFAGFDSSGATETCNALRRLAHDCFVARSN